MTAMLNGRVVLVTGGGSGIGRATTLVLARHGAKVVVSDIGVAGGEETVELVRAQGGDARFVQADVANAEAVDRLVEQTVEAYGRLDGAFNNAGIEGRFEYTIDYPEADFDRVVAVNLKGVWLCMRAVLRQMRKQGGPGAIVNTASVAGLVGMKKSPAYTAAKHGVIGLTKTAALECAKTGIRVNAVCPGVIETPMVERLFESAPVARAPFLARVPLGRNGQPAEIGEAVAWLLSDAASFVTGVAMPVDGGWVTQ